MRPRSFWVPALIVILVLAGVGSYYASAAPDGLEKVAAELGLLQRPGDQPNSGSPLAGYQVAGWSHDRLSGGAAAVIGVLITLALTASLMWLLRRRRVAAG